MCRMKNAFRYSLMIFFSKAAFSLFIALEMFLLIAAANFALGQHNSHIMLYEPVKDHVERPGFLINAPAAERSPLSGRLNTQQLTLENIKKRIGDADILTVRHFIMGEIDITVIPDDVFDKLRLPLEKGNIFDRHESSEAIRIIASSNGNGYDVGDRLTREQAYTDPDGNYIKVGEDMTAEITALLTDPTYISHFRYSPQMSYEYMFMPVDSSYYKGKLFCYTCESEFEGSAAAKEGFTTEPCYIVSFKDNVPESEISALKLEFEGMGAKVIDNSVIAENSRKLLTDSFNRLLPVVLAFGIVVLIGIVSCSVIGAKTMLKKLSIFYCCGATKGCCIAVSVGQTVIISLIAVIASAGAMAGFVLSKLPNKVGFVFGPGNLIMTGAIVLAAILISAIAPVVMISKAEPRELLTETKED